MGGDGRKRSPLERLEDVGIAAVNAATGGVGVHAGAATAAAGALLDDRDAAKTYAAALRGYRQRERAAREDLGVVGRVGLDTATAMVPVSATAGLAAKAAGPAATSGQRILSAVLGGGLGGATVGAAQGGRPEDVWTGVGFGMAAAGLGSYMMAPAATTRAMLGRYNPNRANVVVGLPGPGGSRDLADVLDHARQSGMDAAAVKRAFDLKSAGAPDSVIWRESRPKNLRDYSHDTGIWISPASGDFYSSVYTNPAAIRFDASLPEGSAQSLADTLPNDKLRRWLPRRVDLSTEPLPRDVAGFASRAGDRVVLNSRNARNVRGELTQLGQDTWAHELRHAISAQNGTSVGGNPQSFETWREFYLNGPLRVENDLAANPRFSADIDILSAHGPEYGAFVAGGGPRTVDVDRAESALKNLRASRNYDAERFANWYPWITGAKHRATTSSGGAMNFAIVRPYMGNVYLANEEEMLARASSRLLRTPRRVQRSTPFTDRAEPEAMGALWANLP